MLHCPDVWCSSLQKLHVFLFDKILVITRPVVQNGQQYFQVYRQPIPTVQLTMEDLQDGEFKMGSFRNVITQGQAGVYSNKQFSLAEESHNKRIRLRSGWDSRK